MIPKIMFQAMTIKVSEFGQVKPTGLLQKQLTKLCIADLRRHQEGTAVDSKPNDWIPRITAEHTKTPAGTHG